MTDQSQAWQDVVDQYYTPEEQADWRERMAEVPEFSQEAYQQQWRALSARIEAALPLEPGSDAALAFVREWFALLEPFSRSATPAMWEGTTRMYADMANWEGKVDPAFSSRVWAFIMAAARAAMDRGEDIGPLPGWFTRPAAQEN